MRVRILKPFKDKNKNIIYQEGKKIEVTNERFEEINSTAHGILVEEIKEEKPAKKKTNKK